MVIIMLGVSYSNPRLYVSYRECKIDEGLDVFNRKEYEEQAKRNAERFEKEIETRTLEAAKVDKEVFGRSGGLSIEIMRKALNSTGARGGYSDIVRRAMEKIEKLAKEDEEYEETLAEAKTLQGFILDKTLNEFGDGWQCLSKKQSAARDLLCYLAE
jgi:hypothetical protein